MTKEEEKSNPVSRREFIKGAGLVVGGAAGGAAITYPLAPEKEVVKEVIKEVPTEVIREVINEVPTAAVYEVLPPYGKPTMRIFGEQPETTIVFKGTLEEVLAYYREKMWSDGLPVVPPTVEKVEEFLEYTDYPADAQLTRPLPPSYRIGTPWWVAVNGVMAGCRPEYMPVLIAMTQAWAEPDFRSQDVSSTTGCTPITVINGPTKNQLGINFRQSYGTPGYQSNTSMGRFWTMYKRNLMELRIDVPTDMAAHGMNYLNLAAEDDASCEEYGWKTLAEEQGFHMWDNVVTTMSVLCQSEAPAITGVTGQELLDRICGQICEGACCQWRLFSGQYLFVIPKLVAEVLARDGFDKDDMRDYLYHNARRTARYLETRLRIDQEGYYCQQVNDGNLPQMFCESEDPDRLVPIFLDPKKIFFIVNGDEARNRVECFMSNGGIGPMTSMKMELPENWGALYDHSQLKEDLLKSGQESL